jgi:hypothetical protein
MVQLLSVFVVVSIMTGCMAVVAGMIRGSSDLILMALAGEVRSQTVTALVPRPRLRTLKGLTQTQRFPLRAAA